jgi:hypothetical protein
LGDPTCPPDRQEGSPPTGDLFCKVLFIIKIKNMKTKFKDMAYGFTIFTVVSVGFLNLDHLLENPPEKKLYNHAIKVNNITSTTSAFVQL